MAVAENNAGSGAAAIEASRRRRIWVCADDYGISPSVNVAIRDLVVRERLNATSVMVVAPSFHRSEAVSLDVLNTSAPRVAIGLHLTLTAPFRPSSKAFEPVHEARFMTLAATLRHAAMRRFRRDFLTAEITSQMRAFVAAFGRSPDFVDGHQHVHLFPQISEALLEIIQTFAPNAWLRQCGRAVPTAKRFADRKGLLLDILSYRLRRRSAVLGVATNPAFAGTYRFDDDADFAALFPHFLDRLPADSVLMCHPGFVDDELQRLDSLTALREREYTYLISDAFPAALAAKGLGLT
jgi:chitin disaccharide deacetylase